MDLKGSKTAANLKTAFAGEAQANRRYMYFAARADAEGHSDIATVFRATAEGEAGHAQGFLEYIEAVGDPMTDLPFGDTIDNLRAAIESELYEARIKYPEMARSAREEGFEEIAAWFETLARAERAHIARFQKILDKLESSS
jgi:rubrerythrin